MLYLGADPVPHAAEAVAAGRAAGMATAFVTNNASRLPTTVADQLSALGIPAAADDVVTSGQAVARVLAERLPPGARVLVVGSDALAELLAGAGLVPVREAGDVAAVAQGLATTTGWAELAEAAVALRAGVPWVAGNLDPTLPSPRGPLPGNGALVAALTTVTGRVPEVVGKPEPALHRASVERVGASRPLVVGDRLDTDVLGAVRGGADSLLVLTGVTDTDALLAAPIGSRPTHVGHDLRALARPAPPVQLDADRAFCGSAVANWDDGRVQVTAGAASADEGLRAACALAWARADAELR